MDKQKRKTNNIVEEVFQAIEISIGNFVSQLSDRFIKFISEKAFRRSNKQKIELSTLCRKVKGGHTDAFGYSLAQKKDIWLDNVDLNRNTVVCGTTGAGKNVTLDNIIEHRLKSNLPVVLIDLKGDNQALLNFKSLNESQGRKCYIFSESYSLSDRCNPVLEGDASTIVNRLFSIFDWGEPYYADTNYVALERSVLALKRDSQPVSIKAIYQYLETNLKNKETQNLINKLSKINNSAFGKILSAEDDAITFSKIRKERASVYIGLSTLGFPEISQAIGKLFVFELMYHAYSTFSDYIVRNQEKPSPFSVVIDELGSAVTEDFISLINKCRGAGIGICVSFQLLSDLDNISPSFRDRLIGNMNNFFIGHCHVEGEAEYWAKMIGTLQSKKLTTQTENHLEQSRGSIRDVEEFLVHPNIFKNLDVGQFVIKSFFPNNYLDVVKVQLKAKTIEKDQRQIKKETINIDKNIREPDKTKGWLRSETIKA